ncbi:hypothetical protein [Desulfoluna sp.]|uniref:hypothetical protein n=1 Tax=Desulfoluna sp. TaxID=2045199 RepID=UPI002601BD31|nr:hypothetical protein [Desulfoluna sp.]
MDVDFLLDSDFRDDISFICRKIILFFKTHHELNEIPLGKDKNIAVQEKLDVAKELTAQLDSLNLMFEPYLKLNNIVLT